MINEAINGVYEGLASPEDVDQIMKLGANRPMGPLSLADLIGLDIVLDIMERLYDGFDDSKRRPSAFLKKCATPAISAASPTGASSRIPRQCSLVRERRRGWLRAAGGASQMARHNSSCTDPGMTLAALAATIF